MVKGKKGAITLLGIAVLFIVATGGFIVYNIFISRSTQNVMVKVNTPIKRQKCHFTLFSIYDDYLKSGSKRDLEGNKNTLEQFYENMSDEDFPMVVHNDKEDLYEAYVPDLEIYYGRGGPCNIKVFDPYGLYEPALFPYKTVTMQGLE